MSRIQSSWVCKFLLAAMATGFALALSELIVRAAKQAPAVIPIDLARQETVYRRSTNPLLGYELKQNYVCDSPDFFHTYERTNSHGLRDRKPHSGRKGAEKVAVGDQ